MDSPATVRYLSKNHIRITPAPGWQVVIFDASSVGVEAVVTADDGTETICLGIAPPTVDQKMSILIGVPGNDRGVDVLYQRRTQ